MRTSRSRAVGLGGLISLLAAFIIIAMPARASADENTVTITIGKPGDRWLDAMQFLRVARGQRDKQFGYEVTYLLPGLGEHTLFWPRSKIDLDGSAPRNYRLQVMKLEQGRLFLPDRITSESLPDVHRAILSLEGSYLKAARGDKAAAEAFTTVIILEGTRSGRGSSLTSRASATRPGAGASVKPSTAKPSTVKPTAVKPTTAKPAAAKPAMATAGDTANTVKDWPTLGGMLRSAAKGKGNFGIGRATREQAGAMGKAWVGDRYKIASDGKTLISRDGLRQYRAPSFKPKLGKTQANFEGRLTAEGRWQSNAHLDIVD